MQVNIESSDLCFLTGNAPEGADVPIRVIRAARLKVDLLKAVPKPSQMINWKSLDYREESSIHDSSNCSVHITEGWRLIFRAESEIEPPAVTVTNLRRVPHE